MKRTLRGMTKAQRAVYYREYRQLTANGVDKWSAIKFARRVAYGSVT